MRPSRKARRGLTLVEVMVALAVLSLIVLALGASLRGLSQSSERVDARVEQIDEVRLTVAFLRELLADVSMIRAEGAKRALLFDGDPERMDWIAVMPARFGVGGRHALRLAVETLDDGSTGLVLRYAPWNPRSQAFPDWSGTEWRVLVHGVDHVEIAYDGVGLQTGWKPEWRSQEHLPTRARLDMATSGAAWPTVVLPLRAPASAGSDSGFVIGGSTQ